MHKYTPGQECSFAKRGELRRGLILNAYEEIGGANDGQTYVVVRDVRSKKILHIKDFDITSLSNKV